MGLFGEGWGELKRKLERRKLRKQIAAHDQTLSTLFAQLGDRALASGIDLSVHGQLRDEIGRLEGRAGELAGNRKKLEAERAALEEKRVAENAKFDERRAAVEAKKQPVDAELTAAHERQRRQQGEVSAAESRLRAIASELETSRRQLAGLASGTAPDRQAQIAALETKIRDLAAEQPGVNERITQATTALAPLTDEVSRWSGQSQQFASEIAAIENERKQALDAIATELKRIASESQTVATTAQATGQERTARATDLGRSVYAAKTNDARIAEQTAAVQAEEQRRGATQGALETSEQTTRNLPPHTFLKFVAASMLVAALPVAGI